MLVKARILVQPVNGYRHYTIEKKQEIIFKDRKGQVNRSQAKWMTAAKMNDHNQITWFKRATILDLYLTRTISTNVSHSVGSDRNASSTVVDQNWDEIGQNKPMTQAEDEPVEMRDSEWEKVATTSLKGNENGQLLVKSPSPLPSHFPQPPSLDEQVKGAGVAIGQIDAHDRLLTLIFTCNICQTRSARQFSHHSYTKGIVIIQCPDCKKYHLIADHLGWFEHGKNIEEIMLNKGEQVQRLVLSSAADLPADLKSWIDQAKEVRDESLMRREQFRANLTGHEQKNDHR